MLLKIKFMLLKITYVTFEMLFTKFTVKMINKNLMEKSATHIINVRLN